MLEQPKRVEEDPLYHLLNQRFTVEELRESYPEVVEARGKGALNEPNESEVKKRMVVAIVSAIRRAKDLYSPDDFLGAASGK